MSDRRFTFLVVFFVIVAMLTSLSLMIANSQEDRLQKLVRVQDGIERKLEKLDLKMTVLKVRVSKEESWAEILRGEVSQYVKELREIKRSCLRIP